MVVRRPDPDETSVDPLVEREAAIRGLERRARLKSASEAVKAEARAARTAFELEKQAAAIRGAGPAAPSSVPSAAVAAGMRWESPEEARIRTGAEGAALIQVPINPQATITSLEDHATSGMAYRDMFGSSPAGKLIEDLKRKYILPFNSTLKDGRDSDLAILGEAQWAVTDKLVKVVEDIHAKEIQTGEAFRIPGVKAAWAQLVKARGAEDTAEVARLQTVLLHLANPKIKNVGSIAPADYGKRGVTDLVRLEGEMADLERQAFALNAASDRYQYPKYKHEAALTARGVLQKGWGLGWRMLYQGTHDTFGGVWQAAFKRAPSTHYRVERKPLPDGSVPPEIAADKDLRKLYSRKEGRARIRNGLWKHFVLAPSRFSHIALGPQRNGGGLAWAGKIVATVPIMLYYWGIAGNTIHPLAKQSNLVNETVLEWTDFNKIVLQRAAYRFNPQWRIDDWSSNVHKAASTFFGPTSVDEETLAKAKIELTKTGIHTTALELATELENFDLRTGNVLQINRDLDKVTRRLNGEKRHTRLADSESYIGKRLPSTATKVQFDAVNDRIKDLRSIVETGSRQEAKRALFDLMLIPDATDEQIYISQLSRIFNSHLNALHQAVTTGGDVSKALADVMEAAKLRRRPTLAGVQEDGKTPKIVLRDGVFIPIIDATTKTTPTSRTIIEAAQRGEVAFVQLAFKCDLISLDGLHSSIRALREAWTNGVRPKNTAVPRSLLESCNAG